MERLQQIATEGQRVLDIAPGHDTGREAEDRACILGPDDLFLVEQDDRNNALGEDAVDHGTRCEEWFRTPATFVSDTQVTAKIPVGATHLYVNLIDENRFLFSYPEVPGKQKIAGGPIDVQP